MKRDSQLKRGFGSVAVCSVESVFEQSDLCLVHFDRLNYLRVEKVVTHAPRDKLALKGTDTDIQSLGGVGAVTILQLKNVQDVALLYFR